MAIFIKWLAHASFQIKTKGKVIYIDLTTDGQASEKADLILVTHSHSDHCDPSEIKRVLKKTTDIIAPDDCVAQIGGNVRTLHVGEETTVTGIKVRAVDAYNLKRFR
ncbi:MBL fold metallo-hydrolase, partial [Candidatus Bathyarchaeota archaeon]|nr:MBL fold metallo-hydrolase [Candidatus Bathyarchaeota archaeon]